MDTLHSSYHRGRVPLPGPLPGLLLGPRQRRIVYSNRDGGGGGNYLSEVLPSCEAHSNEDFADEATRTGWMPEPILDKRTVFNVVSTSETTI